jgi:hypothetical protein
VSNRQAALLIGCAALLVYNANLRLIATGDSYPARFLPFALLAHGTVYLDPVLEPAIQRDPEPYWIQPTRNGHQASLFPIVTPVLVTPLYAPAVLYLRATGWKPADVERVGVIMEKLAASLVASLAVALMYLVLRRRLETRQALLLTAVFAFGTGTWSTSSQALWLHAMAELLAVAALWLFTGEPGRGKALLAGAAVALLAANRPPDLFVALALAAYAPFWARRKTPLFVLGAAVPGLLTLAYNLISFHHPAGSWGVSIGRSFFHHEILPGAAALLFSPGRGLLVFYPFLLFLPWGIYRSLQDARTRLLSLLLLGGIALEILFYARTDWRAGFSYGPRYLLDIVPFLIWLLAPALPAFGSLARPVFLSLALLSVGVEAVGAFLYMGTSNFRLYREEYPFDVRPFWQWRNTPFLVEARNPRGSPDLWYALRMLGKPPRPLPPPRTGPVSDFYAVVPCRVADTRTSGRPLDGVRGRRIPIAGAGCSIPSHAVAVTGTVTLIGAMGNGTVSIRADGDRGSFALPFETPWPRAVAVVLPLAPGGLVMVTLNGPGAAYVVVDVTGYFAPATP